MFDFGQSAQWCHDPNTRDLSHPSDDIKFNFNWKNYGAVNDMYSVMPVQSMIMCDYYVNTQHNETNKVAAIRNNFCMVS